MAYLANLSKLGKWYYLSYHLVGDGNKKVVTAALWLLQFVTILKNTAEITGKCCNDVTNSLIYLIFENLPNATCCQAKLLTI